MTPASPKARSISKAAQQRPPLKYASSRAGRSASAGRGGGAGMLRISDLHSSHTCRPGFGSGPYNLLLASGAPIQAGSR